MIGKKLKTKANEDLTNTDRELGEIATYTIFAVVFVAVICLITFIFGYTSNSDSRGTFGDMFGAANALFSGLAFCGVVYAILVQRLEFREARYQFKGQRLALEQQVFESGFFNRLENLRGVVSEFEHSETNTETAQHITFRGSNFFNIKKKILLHVLDTSNTSLLNENQIKKLIYTHFHENLQSELYIYIDGLKDIFEYSATSNHTDKHMLFSTVRAQMTESQKFFLFLVLIQDGCDKDFKETVCQYGLLRGLDIGAIKDKELIKIANNIDKRAYLP